MQATFKCKSHTKTYRRSLEFNTIMTMNYYGFVRVQRISAFEIATIAIELGILISKVLSTFS